MQPLIICGGHLDSFLVASPNNRSGRREREKHHSHSNCLPPRDAAHMKRVEDQCDEAGSADAQDDWKEIGHAGRVGGVPGDDRWHDKN